VQTPYRVADETFVLPFSFDIPGLGLLYLNSMVIRGAEPVLVDTGAPVHREEFLKTAFSLVDPEDVRWIYLSHDDRDHSGNIMQVLERCPNARIVTDFVGFGRMSEEFPLPPNRLRLLNDGETLDVGDRRLTALRPPLFDSPSTRGLWDAKTGVYFSSDCFGSFVPNQAEEVGDVPREAFQQGFAFFNRINHPWHTLVDRLKLSAVIDRIRRLDANVIVSYHAPHARGRSEELLRMIDRVAAMDALAPMTQADLEKMLAGPGPDAKAA
jgi:flavorubredoxin